jgi:PqqD family protein of HPr-rel-A system
MSAPAALHRASDVVFQRLTGEEGSVLLHLGTGQYHTLNPVGTRIWELLESPRTQAELERELEGEFAVEADVLAQDIRSFLSELQERNLVREGAPK